MTELAFTWAKEATLLSYSKNPKEGGKNIFHLDLPTLLASKRIRRHPTEDVSVVHIADVSEKSGDGSYSITWVSGVTVDEITPSGIVSVNIGNVKRFSDVLVGNTIYVFGYPKSLYIKNQPQIDPLRPLLRIGIIAGTNPTKKTIILDCPAYPGNGGGPVWEVEHENLTKIKFRVIGVVTNFVPFIDIWKNLRHNYQNKTILNSGYAVAVPMDPVLELVNSP